MMASGFLPWIGDPAPQVPGLQLAGALLSIRWLPVEADRVAVGVIAVAALGAVHLLTSFSKQHVGVVIRGVTGAVVVAAAILVALRVPLSLWGPGPVVAAVGGAIGTVAAIADMARRRPTEARVEGDER